MRQVIYISTEQVINFNEIDLGGTNYTVDPSSGDISFPADTDWPVLTFNPVTGAFTSVSSADGKVLKLNLSDTGNSYPTSGVDVNFSDLTMYASNKTCKVKQTVVTAITTGMEPVMRQEL